MPAIETAIAHVGRLDDLASGDTPVHRLDPRAKLLTTAAFLVAVASFGRRDVTGPLPLVLYPVAVAAAARLPPGPIVARLLLAAPFALFVGALEPVLDRAPAAVVLGVPVAAGWLSFASILERFSLSVGAALVLVATTGFGAVCAALGRLRAPRVLVAQLAFVHRYLFVLGEEARRAVRAHALRAPDRRAPRARTAVSLIGHLLLRTLGRAERVHAAMRCRGYDGELRPGRPLRARPVDLAWTLGWCAFFAAARAYDVPRWLGGLVLGAGR